MIYDSFSRCHPAVNFVYFALILFFTMFFMNPYFLIISFISSVFYLVMLRGRKAVRFLLTGLTPLMLSAMIISPLFSHEGVTMLFYLPSGNPVTLQSIIYGIFAAIMLCDAFLIFNLMSNVVSSDKICYLFGNIIPSLSLIISMAMRFLPLFTRRLKEAYSHVRKGNEQGYKKLKPALKAFSSSLTWALENTADISNSMVSRGYGLPGRTAYFPFRLSLRDKRLLFFFAFCGVLISSAIVKGALSFRYYPSFRISEMTPFNIGIIILYAVLNFTPVILSVYDNKTSKAADAQNG